MRDRKESEVPRSMFNVKKQEKKLRKLQALESGKSQFRGIPRPMTTYVFVNNISLAVALGK